VECASDISLFLPAMIADDVCRPRASGGATARRAPPKTQQGLPDSKRAGSAQDAKPARHEREGEQAQKLFMRCSPGGADIAETPRKAREAAGGKKNVAGSWPHRLVLASLRHVIAKQVRVGQSITFRWRHWFRVLGLLHRDTFASCSKRLAERLARRFSPALDALTQPSRNPARESSGVSTRRHCGRDVEDLIGLALTVLGHSSARLRAVPDVATKPTIISSQVCKPKRTVLLSSDPD